VISSDNDLIFQWPDSPPRSIGARLNPALNERQARLTLNKVYLPPDKTCPALADGRPLLAGKSTSFGHDAHKVKCQNVIHPPLRLIFFIMWDSQ